ncbi:lipid-A-disaccharide synthase [Parasediminibacterium paludis]|uniref:Lipid-A-disaccharide synthase n=1 Tax=Parasediminibacterium paludis TaxID=908966 RepID=A0ABV8PWJ4_9BACT
MKYYLISGEASGDLHGSNLIKQLLLLDSKAIMRCWGGNLMQEAGATLVKHYRDLAFMGFAEVVKNLPTILKNIRFCKKDVLAFQPDVLILIDYPGFNLRIATWAKQQGIKVVYYISPQVWAWKANRVKKMKQCIDKMLVILPFEKTYFKDVWQWDVEYVGHPLVEVINSFKSQVSGYKLQNTVSSSNQVVSSDNQVVSSDNQVVSSNNQVVSNDNQVVSSEKQVNSSNNQVVSSNNQVVSSEKQVDSSEKQVNSSDNQVVSSNQPIIALLPGSRQQEIAKKLPVMLAVAKHFHQYQFVIAEAPGLEASFYQSFYAAAGITNNVTTSNNKTYQLLSKATAALVTSGTATLETALFGVPEVVCYKGSNISYQIGKRLIKIKFISLVNLIMDKLVVKELIQDEMNATNLIAELEDLLVNTQRQQQIMEDYTALKNKLTQGGNASEKAAKSIFDFLSNQ